MQVKYKVKYPELMHEEVILKALTKWETLTKAKKEPYVQRHKEEQQKIFILYQESVIEDFKKANPDISDEEVLKKIQYNWNGMTKQDKKTYENQHQEKKQSFNEYKEEKQSMLKEEQPDLTDDQITTKLTTNWKGFTKEQKRPYLE